ncbi:MAG: cellulase family glycosylhydrolase [Bacteroidetes bacterium]|nr:cellulase family glycosylhydrolase [Bacteroidota bacterium]
MERRKFIQASSVTALGLMGMNSGFTMAPATMDFLKVHGRKIVNESGREVRLRGFSFASWLNFENFIIGMPGHESGIRKSVAQILGEDKARFFFNSFLNHFVAEDDFKFMQSMGCNLVRIPFNYRHFESDDKPFEYMQEGFTWLDKAIAWAHKYGVYLILDMHAAQGCQSPPFFADNISGMAFLWDQKMYQDRAIALWQEIARHYRNETAIAGYDILNEPEAEHISQLNRFYHEAVKAIRKVDKKHILFIEGDGYSTRYNEIDHPFDSNAVYCTHFYSPCGMEVMEYPGVWSNNGQYYDREKLRQEYIERTTFMRQHNVPNWFGETSVTFTDMVSEDSRMRFLEDMLGIAEEMGDSWTFGIYKDLGKTGIVYANPDSEWVRRIKPVRKAITELHCNPFAENFKSDQIGTLCRDMGKYVKEVIGKLDEQLTVNEMAGTIRFFLCECVLPRQLQIPFAKQFSGMNEEEIDRMMQSFALKNCCQRSGWVGVVKKITGAL